jgi:signal transduction histidine kinase
MRLQIIRRLLPAGSQSRWLALFIVTRVAAALVASALLLAHRITDLDALLVVVVLAYAAFSVAAAIRLAEHPRAWAAWTLDAAVALGLVLAAGDWRSPFYLLLLTTLIMPATMLPPARAVTFVASLSTGYVAVALFTGVDWSTVKTSARLESFATHLLTPVLVGAGLAYSAEVLRRLDAERARSEQLALQAERRRLARELHDSAKQRLHAAHLVLSSIALRRDREDGVDLALRELEAATAEMDASLTDLRTAAGEGTLIEALRRRASALAALTGVSVDVEGADMRLATPVATHVYHVVTEAILNAVRHAQANTIRARVRCDGGLLVATVADDGRGLPGGGRGPGGDGSDLPGDAARPSQGMRSMSERAELLGGRLLIDAGADGRGTCVTLEIPVTGSPTLEVAQ